MKEREKKIKQRGEAVSKLQCNDLILYFRFFSLVSAPVTESEGP